jgi:signal transduction histidine kinase
MFLSTVLIISNEAEFSHAITARWQSESYLPTFTLMSGDLCPGLDSEGFDVAVVGGLTANALPPIIKALEACGKPVIFVRNGNQPLPTTVIGKCHFMTLTQDDGSWLDAVVHIVSESLRAAEASARIQRLLQTNSQLVRDAALGRYILDMRHGLNNALTSVLGNSELLLLEPETLAPLAPPIRSQIDTIHNMALRIHEIMQRFSSLEKEMNVAQKQAVKEGKAKEQAAGASS